MQTVIRYSVVNQDGKPVIRAVPVRRWSDERAIEPKEPAVEANEQTVLRKIRRFRVLDIR
ncbi:MAG TPA: hypothetical protein VHV31_04765 [Nitrolancea sp.]|jgi:hypothetical protein|nr:hypothetical protein [Nitrolancea sp.]